MSAAAPDGFDADGLVPDGSAASALAALVEAIQDTLPQTQCGQCGHQGCAPYATAIARDGEAINRCPPGGAEGIRRLAALTGQPVVPLDPACGNETPRAVAFVDEANCIGCTHCIKACPVDAIIGTHKRMHTVIADLCTGCALCVPPCPVDCISMPATLPDGRPVPAWTAADARDARRRFEARSLRLAREHEERERRLHARTGSSSPVSTLDAHAPRSGVPVHDVLRADAPLPGTAPEPLPDASVTPAGAETVIAPACSAPPTAADDRKRAIVSAAVERARQKAALRAAAARVGRDDH